MREIAQRRALLEGVGIYLITDSSPRMTPVEAFLDCAIAGGVGMVQLREKNLCDADLVKVAQRFAKVCKSRNIPFIVNDRADVALACGADGVHVGQDDMSPQAVRSLAGEEFIIGFSTHDPEQIDQAAQLPVDYCGVGPIHETPTKAGRPAVGLGLVRYAAEHLRMPFFAIGGLDPSNIAEVVAAGARGVSVLRWISLASDPRSAAVQLCERIRDGKANS